MGMLNDCSGKVGRLLADGELSGKGDERGQRHSSQLSACGVGHGGSGGLAQLRELSLALSADQASQATSQRGQLIRSAITGVQAQFEPATWKAFWRTAVDDQPAPEVGQELGMSAGAVRVAKCRVLQRLREELGEM